MKSKAISIERVTVENRATKDDWVAVEDPFEIRVVYGPECNRRSKSLSLPSNMLALLQMEHLMETL
jgi:hypothetical protein